MFLLDRPHQRRRASQGLPGIDVRAGGNQDANRLRLTIACRQHQRRLAVRAALFRACAGLQQVVDHRHVAVEAGHRERRDALAVRGVHLGAGADQEIQRLEVLPKYCPMQRRRAINLGLIDVGFLLQQRAKRGLVAFHDRIGHTADAGAGIPAIHSNITAPQPTSTRRFMVRGLSLSIVRHYWSDHPAKGQGLGLGRMPLLKAEASECWCGARVSINRPGARRTRRAGRAAARACARSRGSSGSARSRTRAPSTARARALDWRSRAPARPTARARRRRPRGLMVADQNHDEIAIGAQAEIPPERGVGGGESLHVARSEIQPVGLLGPDTVHVRVIVGAVVNIRAQSG